MGDGSYAASGWAISPRQQPTVGSPPPRLGQLHGMFLAEWQKFSLEIFMFFQLLGAQPSAVNQLPEL